MLSGILRFLFDLVIFLLNIASWVLLVYVVLQLLLPQNKYTLLAGKYVEPVLSPVRALLSRLFPGLAKVQLDLSPIVLWLLINLAEQLVGLLKRLI